MKRMTLSEYLAVPENYRGVWTTERWDIPDWENLRKSHMGKRTLMVYDKGTCLLVEGLSLEIVDDSSWKKPEEIKEEILLSLADKSGEDFVIAGCFGFGEYENQTLYIEIE